MTVASSPAPAVLVTGGAKRVGAAIVRRFAAAGWGAAIHYGQSRRDAEALADELRAAGRQAVPVGFDLADASAFEAALVEAASALPGLRVLVNSAALFEEDRPEAPDRGVWERAERVNLWGPVMLATRFRALTQGRPGRAVINLLDQKLANLNPDYFSYTLAKAGLAAATEMMALAFSADLRVCGVAPGLTMVSGDQTDSEFALSSRMNLLERTTRPEEIAEAVFFVATSRYASGRTLHVDSGQRLTRHLRDVMFLVREGHAT